jgi:hypothetical protein
VTTSGAVAVIALICTLALAGCGSGPTKPKLSPAELDDAQLTVRVKTALLNHPSLNLAKIDVSTSQGVVILSGTVSSRDEEAASIALARAVEGVREVKSALQIQPAFALMRHLPLVDPDSTLRHPERAKHRRNLPDEWRRPADEAQRVAIGHHLVQLRKADPAS